MKLMHEITFTNSPLKYLIHDRVLIDVKLLTISNYMFFKKFYIPKIVIRSSLYEYGSNPKILLKLYIGEIKVLFSLEKLVDCLKRYVITITKSLISINVKGDR